jgi:hypothetical protein
MEVDGIEDQDSIIQLNEPIQEPTEQIHTFQIFIKATKRKGDKSEFTRANITSILLQAFQQSEPDTFLILPTTTQHRKKIFSSIDTHKTDMKSQDKRWLDFLLHTNEDRNFFGNLYFTSSNKYSTIKKKMQTKQSLQKIFRITTTLNNIDTRVPQK